MIDIKREMKALCKTQEEKEIGLLLIDNLWEIKAVAAKSRFSARKIAPLKTRLRHSLIIRLWKQYDLNQAEIAKLTDTERHTVSRVLKPLGYTVKRDHKVEHQRYLEKTYQELLQMDQPSVASLDSFIVKQQFNGVLNYAEAKARVYKAFPELAKQMQGRMTHLSSERKKELGVGIKLTHTNQARKAFVQGLKLDFPDTNVYQRSAILEGHPERVHRLRDLDSKELKCFEKEYEKGYSALQLADKFDISYKKAVKSLRKLGISVKSSQYQARLKKKNMENLPKKISKEERSKYHRQAENARANVPIDYLGRVPEWAWELVEREPDLLWFDKVASFFSSKQNVIELLKKANQNLDQPISVADLDLFFPPIPHIKAVTRRVYLTFSNDQNIKQLTKKTESIYERRLEQLLKFLKVKYILHDRKTIGNHELDFYLPDQGIAIEASPVRTHNSNTYNSFGFPGNNAKPHDYHQKKMKLCRDKGITLITLFEKTLQEPYWSAITVPALKYQITGQADQALSSQDVDIAPIKKQKARKFLNKWHFDGYCPSQYAFGVINKQDGRMVGAATFSIPKDTVYKSKSLLELKRVGWQAGVHVENGISMILKKVQQSLGQHYSGVLAYSDNDLGNGSEYKNSGFTLIGESGPQLIFINPAHPRDTYDSTVATRQSAENGVIAKRLQPMNITDQEAAQIVEEQLPWRIGKGHGYASQYDTGSKTGIKKW